MKHDRDMLLFFTRRYRQGLADDVVEDDDGRDEIARFDNADSVYSGAPDTVYLVFFHDATVTFGSEAHYHEALDAVRAEDDRHRELAEYRRALAEELRLITELEVLYAQLETAKADIGAFREQIKTMQRSKRFKPWEADTVDAELRAAVHRRESLRTEIAALEHTTTDAAAAVKGALPMGL